MERKSVGLNILWWVEAVISLRVLLFTAPVLANKWMGKSLTVSAVDDQLILVLTITAVYYLVIGAVSIIGFAYWKVLHFLGVVFIFILTVGSFNAAGQELASLGLFYYSPIIFSALVTLCAGVLGGSR